MAFRGGLAQLYSANLSLRVASRVIVRVAEFHAESFHELERRANRIRWNEYVRAGSSVRFRVTCRKSRLYHSDAVAQRLAAAVVKQIGELTVGAGGGDSEEDAEQAEEAEEAAAGSPNTQLFIVRLAHDNCVVSVDSSGALLHRRGYRLATGKAPLRETVAAAMVIASGWDRGSPLLDPMCGSGTIAIEAALRARGIAPGAGRSFAFQDWPNYRPELWESVKARAAQQAVSGHIGAIMASDRDDGVVKLAQANAKRAGVGNDIDFKTNPISAIDPLREIGYVITNPPYGARVGDPGALRNLYAQLGKVLRANASGSTLAFLSADRTFDGSLRIPLEEVFRARNGGISVRFVKGRIA